MDITISVDFCSLDMCLLVWSSVSIWFESHHTGLAALELTRLSSKLRQSSRLCHQVLGL